MGHELFGDLGDPCDGNPAALLDREWVVSGLEVDRGRDVVPEAEARLQVEGVRVGVEPRPEPSEERPVSAAVGFVPDLEDRPLAGVRDGQPDAEAQGALEGGYRNFDDPTDEGLPVHGAEVAGDEGPRLALGLGDGVVVVRCRHSPVEGEGVMSLAAA